MDTPVTMETMYEEDIEEKTVEAEACDITDDVKPSRKFRKPGKWSKYEKRASSKWDKDPELQKWLLPVEGDPTKVACRYCQAVLRAHRCDLRLHAKTAKHQRNDPEAPDPPADRRCKRKKEGVRPRPPKQHSPGKFKWVGNSRVLFVTPQGTKCEVLDPELPQQEEDHPHDMPMMDSVLGDLSITGEAAEKVITSPANLGFVGCGNMAQALINAILKKGLVDVNNVIASAPSDRNLSKLQSQGIITTHNNNDVVKASDVVFLGVKPHLLTEVLEGLQPLDAGHSPLFVSMVTGFSTRALEEMLATLMEEPRVVRIMPNTPCMVGQGCCLFSMGTYTLESDNAAVTTLMGSVGMVSQVPEPQMDAACGLAGSGPAYIYSAIEAMADGGVKMGLPRHLAQSLAAHTVRGAACMVLETGKHPAQLKDEVCSPAGTTIAAMHSLEASGFRNALISAVEASARRSKELGSKD